MPVATSVQIHTFITREKHSAASERSNYQMFLEELCAEVLGTLASTADMPTNRWDVDRPHLAGADTSTAPL